MVAGQWDFGNGKNKKVIIRCKQKNATLYNMCLKIFDVVGPKCVCAVVSVTLTMSVKCTL